jgi:hypothetical protein
MSSRFPSRMPRRDFVGCLTALGAAGLLAGCVAAGRAPAVGRRRRFRFVVINDLHHGGPECTPFFAGLVEQIRAHGDVAFCLLVGDLADTGLRGSLEAVRDTFATLRVPIHPVPGNHDCDVPNNTSLYAEAFPGKLNYSFAHGGWQFVGFDSTQGKDWRDTRVGPAALAFLDEAGARLDPAAPTVVFTHFPMDPAVRMASLNAADALGRLGRLNLRAGFSGHFHGQTENPHRGAPLVTNACCARVRNNHDGTIPEGYWLCTAQTDGTLVREFTAYAPAWPAVAPKPIG